MGVVEKWAWSQKFSRAPLNPKLVPTYDMGGVDVDGEVADKIDFVCSGGCGNYY